METLKIDKSSVTSKANGGECLIFPSKENRDWSTFKKPCQFKKGELILVSDIENPTENQIFIRYFDSMDENHIRTGNKDGVRWHYAWKYDNCPLPLNIGGDE